MDNEQRWTPPTIQLTKITKIAWSQPFQFHELTDGTVWVTYDHGKDCPTRHAK